ncbi:MAG: isoaspartyl peptidase/L-asparaginase [Gemmataceae bacterium]|nr:isoaspartyl peptidase/L-asparaginase [Gemmataceae bacterium]
MMKPLSVWLLLAAVAPAADVANDVVLAVHGGVGVPENLPPEKAKLYAADLEAALKAGLAALKAGTHLDGVEAAIMVLEDSPRFNAGRGAVFTSDGTVELDASIMEGTKREGGAVAGVSRLKNPIRAARTVMTKSEHVLLVGAGAERFATANGCTEVSPTYFWTPERWEQLRKKTKFGTVGAVARDSQGRLAAGTSTGGMTGKRPGRLGDSPILGAGTYADDRGAAVSCSGHGEVFIRQAVAHDLVARMRYQKLGVAEAAAGVFAEMPAEEGGVGGLIALDPKGRAVFHFDTDGMFRGWITADGKVEVRTGR